VWGALFTPNPNPNPNPNPTQRIQSCRMGETVYHSFSPSMLECDLKQCKESQPPTCGG